MKEVVPYLTFDGNCREAMIFYAQCLGAGVELIRFSDHMPSGMPQEMEASKDRIMHARLTKGSASLLMASDNMMGMPLRQGTNFSVSVHCESLEEIERFFDAFNEGATVTMPLQDASWGARFGMLTDRFGIQWMFNFEYPRQG